MTIRPIIYPVWYFFRKNSENGKSSLIQIRIEKRLQQISEDAGSAFAKLYSHSEQAILIYLMQNSDESLRRILPQIPTGSTIITFILNIVSSNDMCERCGDTFFRAIEEKRIASIWEPVLKKEGYIIPSNPEGIHFFIACVGLHQYPDDNLSILRDKQNPEICSVYFEGKDGIDLLKYKYPTVAQHYLSAKRI